MVWLKKEGGKDTERRKFRSKLTSLVSPKGHKFSEQNLCPLLEERKKEIEGREKEISLVKENISIVRGYQRKVKNSLDKAERLFAQGELDYITYRAKKEGLVKLNRDYKIYLNKTKKQVNEREEGLRQIQEGWIKGPSRQGEGPERKVESYQRILGLILMMLVVLSLVFFIYSPSWGMTGAGVLSFDDVSEQSENNALTLLFEDSGKQTFYLTIEKRNYTRAYFSLESQVSKPKVDIFADGQEEWSYQGEKASGGLTPDFSQELNNYLLACSSPCSVPVEIEADSGGSVVLTGLVLEYSEPAGLGILPVVENVTEDLTLPGENFTENLSLPLEDITSPTENASLIILPLPEENLTLPGENLTENMTLPQENLTLPLVNLTENLTLPQENLTRFILKKAQGEKIAFMDEEGNMYLKGKLSEGQTFLNPTPASFLVLNASGEPLAYINNVGDAFLRGVLIENINLSAADSGLAFQNSFKEIIALFDEQGNLKLKGGLRENYVLKGGE